MVLNRSFINSQSKVNIKQDIELGVSIVVMVVMFFWLGFSVVLLELVCCDKDYYYLPLRGSLQRSYYFILYVGNPPQPQAFDPDTGSSQLYMLCDHCVGCDYENVLPKYEPKASISSTYVRCKDKDFRCSRQCVNAGDTCKQEVIYGDRTSFSSEVIRDEIRFDLQQNTDVYLTEFNCIRVYEHTYYMMKQNGIMGLSQFDSQSILFKWFARKESHLHKFSVCMGQTDGFFQIGDITSSNNPNNTLIPLQVLYHYGVNDFKHLYFGQTDLRQKISHKCKLIIDTGATFTHFPTSIFKPFIKSVNSVCDRTMKCNFVEKGYYGGGLSEFNCFQFYFQEEQTLQDFFPVLQIVLNTDSVIYFEPSSYFHKQGLFTQSKANFTNLYCLSVTQLKKSSQLQEQTILGIGWLQNKKVTFDLQKGVIEVQYNQTCFIQKAQTKDNPYQIIILISIAVIISLFLLSFCIYFRKQIHSKCLLVIRLCKKKSNLTQQIECNESKDSQKISQNHSQISVENRNEQSSQKPSQEPSRQISSLSEDIAQTT